MALGGYGLWLVAAPSPSESALTSISRVSVSLAALSILVSLAQRSVPQPLPPGCSTELTKAFPPLQFAMKESESFAKTPFIDRAVSTLPPRSFLTANGAIYP